MEDMQKCTDGGKAHTKAIGMALLAALLYGISAPFSKWLLKELSPTFMAALLYIGAGLGLMVVNLVRSVKKGSNHQTRMTAKEGPFILAMILLDIAAPILLMLGLTQTTSANASLLNNFEIVATAFIALVFFKEAVGRRMWLAIGLITLSTVILSFENMSSFTFSIGSLFVILACIAWGIENNCTRVLSLKDPLQVVVIKGFGSGLGSLLICFYLNSFNANWVYIGLTLLLGFFAYGLSIFFYVSAQRSLGAARTSAYYAAAPFVGVLISWLVLRESPTVPFYIALAVMLLGTYFTLSENETTE